MNEEIKLNWNFDAEKNKLNFFLNKSFKNATLVLKERTSNLTCFRWSNVELQENVNYFIVPTNSVKLIDTDFTGFIFKLYLENSRLFESEIVIFDKPSPKYFYSDNITDYTIPDAFYVQYLDFYNNSFLNNIVKDGDVILDVGASCGTFAHFCLKRNAKKVICLEPSISFDILNKTFDHRVERYNAALGKVDGYSQFYLTDQTTLNSFKIENQKKYDTDKLIGTPKSTTVKCVSLTSIIKESNVDKIDLLKMDIEGYEYDIFNSLSINDLSNINQVLVEFHHNENHKTQFIVDKLIDSGFDLKYLNLNFQECYSLLDLKGVIYGIKKNNTRLPFNFEKFFSKYEDAIKKSSQQRVNFYKYIIPKLVSLNRPVYVMETGTMWESLEKNMGAFTLIMADLIKNYTGGKLYTVDISKPHLEACKSHTKQFSDVIEYIESDSIKYLKELSDSIINSFDLVYLDSYDLNLLDSHNYSAKHHLAELEAIYSRLNPNCSVAIDDNFLPGTYVEWLTCDLVGNVIGKQNIDVEDGIVGKGKYCHEFLTQRGWKRFENLDIHGQSNIFYYERIK